MRSGFLGRGIGPTSLMRKARITPDQVVGLQLWLKADSLSLNDGDAITTWSDSSAYGRNATQAEAGKKPTYKTGIINSLPVARFDGGDALLLAAALLSDDIFSIFLICRVPSPSTSLTILAQHPNTGAVNRTIFVGTDTSNAALARFFFNNGSSYSAISTTPAYSATPSIVYSFSDGAGNSHVRVNGSAAQGAITGQTWTPYDTPFSIGATAGAAAFITGDIAEIIVYGTALSDANRLAVERYLSAKYGIALA